MRQVVIVALATTVAATGIRRFDGNAATSPTGSAMFSSTGISSGTGNDAVSSATGIQSNNILCFDQTISVEPNDTCGTCLCEAATMEKQSQPDLHTMLESSEQYCLKKLRQRDGINLKRIPFC